MRSSSLGPVVAATLAILVLPSCMSFGVSGHVGYAQMAVDGDIALSPTAGGFTGTIQQDIESGLGLGDENGTPYIRAELDAGVPVLSVSYFSFDESGRGTLDATFGGITVGTDVQSELTFTNVKTALAFEFDVGPVSLAPGIAIDLFDIDLQVRDTGGFTTEDIDVTAPLPMLFLRGQVDLGVAAVIAELGVIDTPEIQDIEGTFWDAEVLVEVRPTAPVHLFAGYRLMNIDAEGTVDGQDFAADLQVSGWVIGGGIRF